MPGHDRTPAVATSNEPQNAMRTIAYSTIICLAVITAIANLFPWVVSNASWGVVEFEIPPGATSQDVAEILFERGLIANPDIFVVGAVLRGADRKMAAGRYVIEPRTSLLSLYDLLRRGQQHLNLVTIPEGLTLNETIALLADTLDMAPEELERWAADPELLDALGIEGGSVEGYIFPESYDMPLGAGARDIISTMVKKALQVYSDLRLAAQSPSKLTMREVFTLASIVEAEVTMHDEAPRVAAVFLNRLRKGMLLQADPTVAYALGGRKQRITYSDLEVDSPYNTYRYSGLPPGPICNPGANSLNAVLNPMKPSEEMYFVARGDGRHVFSKTMNEHVRAKRLVRQGRALEPGGPSYD
jgi:UPF0755 protein